MRTALKGQALTDFNAEFTFPMNEHRDHEDEKPQWNLYVDRSANEDGFGYGPILISHINDQISIAIRFSFKASNNEVEFKAFIVGLLLERKLESGSINVICDSQLGVRRISRDFQATNT